MSDLLSARLDRNPELHQMLMPYCRLKPGEIWIDPDGRHIVGCGDAADFNFVHKIFADFPNPKLAVHDPPYNMVFGHTSPVEEFIWWCQKWVKNSYEVLDDDSSLYIWLGADQNHHFQPLPQFMQMMCSSGFDSRSFITMRNQRGYGTSNNWMAVRQELLYYTKGQPSFKPQYTDIPKILRGYYKEVNGRTTENVERGKSPNIRPGNVWVDVQQVFYRMEENVGGCYAQKPLKAIERIVSSSSEEGDSVADFFAHSGTTLIACERLNRRCLTIDIDPVFAEISIRRLEHLRRTGKTGWQRGHPFASELIEISRQSELHTVTSAQVSS
jgi:site-specific DNA-methyltransferase (adenine-specific)